MRESTPRQVIRRDDPKNWRRLEECCAFLQCSLATLYKRYINPGHLKMARVSNGQVVTTQQYLIDALVAVERIEKAKAEDATQKRQRAIETAEAQRAITAPVVAKAPVANTRALSRARPASPAKVTK